MSPDSTLANVDCFHAIDGGGNCLIGPHVPLGLVRPGPDCVNYNTTGYASGEPIIGFSHLHVSGTGGRGRYGNILVTPLLLRPDPRLKTYNKANETATPGYYAVDLSPREVFGEMQPQARTIRCELTSTSRVFFRSYTRIAIPRPGY
ncbi:MAG: hypothetical protein LR015_01600 [Verrucomicrobia bacterium]|nr:hypothetical protein [Verrucomicrobiota bacterium]